MASSSDILGINLELNDLSNICLAKLFIPLAFCPLNPQLLSWAEESLEIFFALITG